MGLGKSFKSGREINRWVDECARLTGESPRAVMKLTAGIAQATGFALTRGEALVGMVSALQLLDQHEDATAAMNDFGEKFDKGELTTHEDQPLSSTVPSEIALQLFVKTAQRYRPHLAS